MLLFMTFIKQLHRNKNYVKEEKDEALKHQLIRSVFFEAMLCLDEIFKILKYFFSYAIKIALF